MFETRSIYHLLPPDLVSYFAEHYTLEKDLESSAELGRWSMVEKLIRKGANIKGTDQKGGTILSYAVHNKDIKMVKMLIREGANVNARDHIGYSTILGMAAYEGYKEIVEILINAGANVNGGNNLIFEYGEYHSLLDAPLIKATGYNFIKEKEAIDIVKMLIENGANVNIDQRCGYTSLMNAAFRGSREIVDMLIKAGANVNAGNYKGWTALMAATNKGPPEIVKMMINAGADVNAVDNEGYTALMKAAEHIGCYPDVPKEILKILITAGADPKIRNNKGETARDIHKNDETFDYIISKANETPVQRKMIKAANYTL